MTLVSDLASWEQSVGLMYVTINLRQANRLCPEHSLISLVYATRQLFHHWSTKIAATSACGLLLHSWMVSDYVPSGNSQYIWVVCNDVS
jgi:hypothetical protein